MLRPKKRRSVLLYRAFLACEHDNDEDDDDDDMARAGWQAAPPASFIGLFPDVSLTRPVSVSRSIATALDDASTPQQAASYVAVARPTVRAPTRSVRLS